MIAYDLLAVAIDLIMFYVKTKSKNEQWSPLFCYQNRTYPYVTGPEEQRLWVRKNPEADKNGF